MQEATEARADEAPATDAPLTWRGHVRAVRAAAGLSTRVPVGGFPYADVELRWSAAYLPLVGGAIGVALGCVFFVFTRAGELVAASVVIAASLLITGALHEDGLADTADALGGGATRERILVILKDSRIGTYGAAALVATMAIRISVLARLGVDAPAALVLAHAASRAAPSALSTALPYVTDPAVSKSRAIATAGASQAIVAIGAAIAIATSCAAFTSLSPMAVVAAVLFATCVVALAGLWFRARLGGITGDLLGAAQQLAEITILLTLVMAKASVG